MNRYLEYDCAGCKSHHSIPVSGSKAWGFNEDTKKPTLSPSVLYREFDDTRDVHPTGTFVCHHFLRGGVIEYLSDCTHELAGKKVSISGSSIKEKP